MAGLVGRHGGVAARRRALVVCGVLVDGAERDRLDGTGEGEGQRAGVQVRYSWPGSERGVAAAQRARCSSALLRAQGETGRARERERGERKRVERERERSTEFDSK